MRKALLSMILIVPGVGSIPQDTYGQDFTIDWYTIDAGGIMSSTDGQPNGLELSGTIGQHDASVMTGGSFTLVGGFWAVAAATVLIPGDCDADGDLDLADYACLADCLSGPDTAAPQNCEPSDFDADADVDLPDFAEFQVQFGS